MQELKWKQARSLRLQVDAEVQHTGGANEVTVGKRGSVIIPKDMAEGLGIAVGDKFSVRKTKAGIALRKI